MTQEKKIALVTGASRGIGKAIACELARQGITVIGTATSEEGANAITAMLATENSNNQGMVLDIGQKDSINNLVTEINQKHGDISILINNAAITRDNLLLRMKDEDWEKIITTNLNSVFYLSKLVIKGMMKARWGRIITISSIVGVTGNPGQANYAAAKAGVIGFSKSLAQEIASRNITVNVVAPGFIDTDMTRELTEEQRTGLLNKIPMQRLGSAEDIAHTVAFLTSPKADYISGQTIHVNGGMYMN